jgi:hypothetical protein
MISVPYPSGWSGWLADTKVQHDALDACSVIPESFPRCLCTPMKHNGALSSRRLRFAEFFPAVEPAAAVSRDSGLVKAKVVFKELATRVPSPGTGHYPYGYDAMVNDYNGTSWAGPSRLYNPMDLGIEPQMPEPSYENQYVHEEPVLLRGGTETIALFQHMASVHAMRGIDLPLQNSPYPTSVDYNLIAGARGTVSTNGIAAAAWFKLVKEGGGVRRVRFQVWGLAPGTGTDPQAAIAELTPNPENHRDFEARVLGVVSVATGTDTAEFRIATYQDHEIWSTNVTVAKSGGTTTITFGTTPRTQVAATGIPGHKLEAGVAENGVVMWSHEGHVRAIKLP